MSDETPRKPQRQRAPKPAEADPRDDIITALTEKLRDSEQECEHLRGKVDELSRAISALR